VSLENPFYLLLLVPAAVAAAARAIFRRALRRREPASRFPAIELAGAIRPTLRARTAGWLWTLRIAALCLVAIAIARPRRGIETVHDTTKGVDIVLCIDVSGSMRETDLAQGESRIAVARRVAAAFVDRRTHDRIALVPFAKYAYRLCPLTLHHGWVKEQLGRLRIRESDRRGLPKSEEDRALIDETRTAIGTAINVAVNALRNSTAKSKVVILLTDGQSNFGKLDPLQAAQIAKEFGVRVYTIGAGSIQEQRAFGMRIGTYDPVDEETLREVASKTGGRYFRAQDAQALERIYAEIDELEKTEIESVRFTRYREQFAYAAAPAAALAWLEIIAGLALFRRLP